MSWPWVYLCANCSVEIEIDIERSVCNCGGLLNLKQREHSPATQINPQDSMGGYRYSDQLPCNLEDIQRVSLGADMVTPLLPYGERSDIWLKCDQLLPTGSFKDRGATILVAFAIHHDIKRIVLDSSGNAGASIAAHAARAGIECEIFVPDTTSIAKIQQMRAMGAKVVLVAGPRERAEFAAQEAARKSGRFYASHVFNPHFHHGVKIWSFEVFDQLGKVPGTVLIPVGNGSLLLGIVLGFRELLDQGRIQDLPNIIAVQSQAHSTLGFNDTRSLDGDTPRKSVAEGVAVSDPPRRKEIVEALADTDGLVVVVNDVDILKAQRELGKEGFYVEPTGALALAGYRSIENVEPLRRPVVLALTGSGFKSVK